MKKILVIILTSVVIFWSCKSSTDITPQNIATNSQSIEAKISSGTKIDIEMTHSGTDGTVYHGLFRLESGKGKIRINYTNYTGSKQVVEQSVILQKDNDGNYRLACTSPYDVIKQRVHPTYSADNFYFVTKDGKITMVNIDDLGNRSNVNYQEITASQDLNLLLKELLW
jgi:hypothetical protein